MSYNHEQLSQWSGEDQVKQAPRYEVPLIKLDGENGGFYEPKGRDERNDKGERIEGIILKVRRTIRGYREENETTYYTREHNAWNEKVELIESQQTPKGPKTRLVDVGTYQYFKNNPDWAKTLRLNMVLYMLVAGEIVKLIVRGKGCSYLFAYFQEFESNEHIYEYKTNISFSEEKHPRLRKKYYAMNFNRGEKLADDDMELVSQEIKKVNDEIQKVENFYAKRQMEREAQDEAAQEVDQDPDQPQEGEQIIDEEEAQATQENSAPRMSDEEAEQFSKETL